MTADVSSRAPGFAGVIFDVDGVLVDSPHEQAWRESLAQLMTGPWRDLAGRTTWTPDAFTSRVYREVLSGKPRHEGALACLEYFLVPDARRREREYSERKQTMLLEMIEAGRFDAYSDGVRFVLAMRSAGIPVAAASSSKNARRFLRAIRLRDFGAGDGVLLDVFDADLSGRDFAQGKPDPEIFLTAASELGVSPARCVVVEDAVSGVQAAKAGTMVALGVARAGDEHELAQASADLVVTSLDEVDREAFVAGRLVQRAH
ncbi:HAD-IA family hydrolase [Rhodococcus sp. F64268]|uniref:HAD family hydrolase n=1 Tax=unclassified Rhodococcus (in: high G+C Gram-positive bacteria) TaxID=192944 RepID=UPI001FF68274|nr:HAD-IA family hydrolase [Rhodococcus sp. F64268]MCK0093424.1 HAD-IA family hydrolase [Rhodococcus sp. F64268]